MLEQYGDVLSVTELQDILSIGRNFAYYLLQTGQIPSIRMGKKYRIPKDAVLHYLSQWKHNYSSRMSSECDRSEDIAPKTYSFTVEIDFSNTYYNRELKPYTGGTFNGIFAIHRDSKRNKTIV